MKYLIIFLIVLSMNLIYKPQKDITAYELSEVLKVFLFVMTPNYQETRLIDFYKTLEPKVQRHFYIKEY